MNFTVYTFNFNRQLIVRHEPVFRCLDEREYLDHFFDNGELLLSCFTLFRQYPNEIQGDKHEGHANLVVRFADDKTFIAGFAIESNAFVLSTTKSINQQIIEDFNSIGAIKINNPIAFATEVSNRIPNYTFGTVGNCIYQKDRIIRRDLTEEQSKRYSKENLSIIENQFKLIDEVSNNDELFIKLNKHSYQNEYRFVWFTNKIQNNHLIIYCPEAIQFCERIDF